MLEMEGCIMFPAVMMREGISGPAFAFRSVCCWPCHVLFSFLPGWTDNLRNAPQHFLATIIESFLIMMMYESMLYQLIQPGKSNPMKTRGCTA